MLSCNVFKHVPTSLATRAIVSNNVPRVVIVSTYSSVHATFVLKNTVLCYDGIYTLFIGFNYSCDAIGCRHRLQ